MAGTVRIALDAMGGDYGAAVVIPGAELSQQRHPDAEFLLFGDRLVVEPLLATRPSLKAAAKFTHTDVAVAMGAKPGQAVRPGGWERSMGRAPAAGEGGGAGGGIFARTSRVVDALG